MRRALLAFSLALPGGFALALAALAGCHTNGAHEGWQGRIEVHGTMREVMMEGRTEGRVELVPLQGDPARIGIGSLAGLEGEIVLVDGVAWITRSAPLGVLETYAGAKRGESATMLATAEVARWIELPIPGGVAADALEGFVAERARENGLAHTPVYPFVIEGELDDLRVHVLHGRCPMAGPGPAESEPVRRLVPSAHGRLVGFHSELPPGTLTHHGETQHLHVLLRGSEPLAAHVDSVRVGAGAVLRLPAP